ncbi:DUF6415 family natural product biosynthesis protein [Streptomyces sp. NPDC093982]|uniref:DUF6415 family natural product biosynthesis protein n=1 Tax=Streptomyces sp. NPDC093982 TaxID=3155077 RepID=UPI00343B7979
MRETVQRLLGPDDNTEALPSTDGELGTLTLALHGHLEMILPEVERTAGPRPSNVHAYCALACVGEARQRLAITPRPTLAAGVTHARHLARCLHALCDHYERLTSTTS